MKPSSFFSYLEDKHYGKLIDIMKQHPELVHEKDSHGNTALHKVCSNGSINCLKLLIKAGANFLATNKRNETPIFEAVKNEREKCLLYLLETNKSLVNHISTFEGSLVHIAQRHYDPSILSILLKARAPLEAKNRFGETPLLEAIKEGNSYMACMLLEAGANPNVKNSVGFPAIQLAMDESMIDVFSLMLKKNVIIVDKAELLFRAIVYNMPDILKELLKLVKKKDLERMMFFGPFNGTPFLFLAIQHSALECLPILMSYFDINKYHNYLGNSLHEAAYHQEYSCLRYLLSSPNADIHACDVSYRSILHILIFQSKKFKLP
mmetsp:Transcript_403/g.742  ORF Transcript_403/g.742 Transcript_403/m.742 type:complete len:321 (+) Transcript_403:1179-2141(+)